MLKLLLQVVVCSGLSVVFQRLLFAYWEQKEGPSHLHQSDSWAFGVLAGVIFGYLIVEGILD